MTFYQRSLKYILNNAHELHNIPTDVKNHLERMLTEQGLYEQAIILFQKDLKIMEETNNKMNVI